MAGIGDNLVALVGGLLLGIVEEPLVEKVPFLKEGFQSAENTISSIAPAGWVGMKIGAVISRPVRAAAKTLLLA